MKKIIKKSTEVLHRLHCCQGRQFSTLHWVFGVRKNIYFLSICDIILQSYIMKTTAPMSFSHIPIWNPLSFNPFEQKWYFFPLFIYTYTYIYTFFFFLKIWSILTSWIKLPAVKTDRVFQTIHESDVKLRILRNFLSVNNKTKWPISKIFNQPTSKFTVMMQKVYMMRNWIY